MTEWLTLTYVLKENLKKNNRHLFVKYTRESDSSCFVNQPKNMFINLPAIIYSIICVDEIHIFFNVND